MISDITKHAAALFPGVGWVVSWLPGWPLTRNQAVTAMTLAEAVAEMQEEGRTRVVDHTHPLWPHIDAWAAELGLTGPDAMVRICDWGPEFDQPAAADPADPGPVPAKVEPQTGEGVEAPGVGAPEGEEPGAAYPIPRPEEGEGDDRFTFGLFLDVGRVLSEHGYPPFVAGRDLVRLRLALFSLIYQPAEVAGGERR